MGTASSEIEAGSKASEFVLEQSNDRTADRVDALHLSAARAVALVTALASLGFGVLFLYVAVSRVRFPFDLEWGEGLFVDHVARIVHGQQLYVQPSINFTPLVYTPGYYYLSAVAARAFGVGVATLRGVSILCSLLFFALLVAFGRRELGTTRDGIVVGGLFAACYAIGGAWLDIAREDALLLVLVFGAAYLIRYRKSTTALVVAGLLLTAAVLTKQVALTLAPPLLVYGVIRHGLKGLAGAAASLVSLILLVALLQWINKGWFLYYTFTVLSRAQTAWLEHPMAFWTSDLFGRFPIGTILGLAWCAVGARYAGWRDWAFYVVFGAGVLSSTWEARVHPGAWFNTLIPAYAFLALAALRMSREIDRKVAGAGTIAIAIQLALLVYSPARYIPAQQEWTAAAQLADTIRRVPGDVLFFDHAHWSAVSGKRSHVHEMAVRDVLAAHDRWGDDLRDQIRRALSEEQFDVVIQDSPNWFPIPLNKYYRPTAAVLTPHDVLTERVGNPIYPATIYLPRVRHVEWPPSDPAAGGR